MIHTQLVAECASDRGFREAVSQHFASTPLQSASQFILYASWIDTPVGSMIAMASESALYLLEFLDRRDLERGIARLKQKTKALLVPGKTPPIVSIEQELLLYFDGKLKHFKTPVVVSGSPFQQKVWDALKKIPSGETRSYLDIAKSIEQATACRAVARANGANQLAIIIPCHRVVNKNGQLGGYGGGVARKEWLLKLEKED